MRIELLKRSAWLIAAGLGLSAQVLGQSSGCGGETQLTYHEDTYNLVEVQGVCWFAGDLKTKNLNTGVRLYDASSDAMIDPFNPWVAAMSQPSFIEYYGTSVVYDYYALTSDKLCPKGWHVPSVDDWNAMLDVSTFGVLSNDPNQGLMFINNAADVWGDTGWGVSTSQSQGVMRTGDYQSVGSTGSGASTRCVKD